MTRFFATASRGAERSLAEELGEIGAGAIEERRAGVVFGERLEDAYRACLWSRIASRVLLPLTRFEADGADDLYEAVHAVAWTDHVGPERTIAVDVAGGDSPAGPPHYVALKTKDAIVDRIREAEGARPSVDTAAADLRVHVHLSGPAVTVSLDLSGRGRHRRGIARAGAEAPLRESLAAALLRIAGWPARSAEIPLLDPMCGSGTLLLEAAWIALDVAPGLLRGKIGAEGWRGHDSALWERVLAEARERRARARGRSVRIAGSDSSQAAVRATRASLGRAGLSAHVRVEVGDLRGAAPPWLAPGLIVTNPPYGARLGEEGELGPLYEALGDVLKRRFAGWTAWVLSGNPVLAKRIGLRPASRRILHNGPIECRFLEIPIVSGARGEQGPGWRRPSAEAAPFAKRLARNLREVERWAGREGVTCYRIYDRDMPEYNLAVDWYDGAARVEEYEAPAKVAPETAARHLRDALRVVPEALGIRPADVVLRVRRRRRAGEQHERRDDRGGFREVREGAVRFLVNLTDFLDTGLFLDDRILRRRARERSAGRTFLNLFAYTCSASVSAALGGARSTTSVDLSNAHLAWGRRNFALNGLGGAAHRFVRADVLRWIERRPVSERYDLVLVAPPVHSRSKGMRSDFDVQRDHAAMLRRISALLAPGGEIWFSTILRGFVLDERGLGGLAAQEITEEITPPDFARRPRLRAWVLRLAPHPTPGRSARADRDCSRTR